MLPLTSMLLVVTCEAYSLIAAPALQSAVSPATASATAPAGRAAVVYVDDDNVAGPWDGTAEHPYRTVGQGFAAVAEFGTVYVASGVYPERLVLNKTAELMGEDQETTIIDGGHVGDVIQVTADGVSISGFTIRNAGSHVGIDLLSDGNLVDDNIITDNLQGIVLRDSSSNVLSNNFIANSGFWGAVFVLGASDNNDMIGNIFMNNDHVIWYYYSDCVNNSIMNNLFLGNGFFCVELDGTTGCTIADNDMYFNRNGVYLYDSVQDSILNNRFYGSEYEGVHIRRAVGATIRGNEMGPGGQIGFTDSGNEAAYWDTHDIEDNTIEGRPIRYYCNTANVVVPPDAAQVIMGNCTNSVVEGLVTDTPQAVQLGFCSNIEVRNNHISTQTYGDGIFMLRSDHCVVSDNIITCAYPGINHPNALLWGIYSRTGSDNSYLRNVIRGFNGAMRIEAHIPSDNNVIVGNDIETLRAGIWLMQYSQTTIIATGNRIEDNVIDCPEWDGVFLYYLTHVAVRNNEFQRAGLGIQGREEANWSTHTIEGNTVGGKPLVYEVGKNGLVVPPGAGQVILSECEGFTIDGQEIDRAGYGVQVAHSNNGAIANNAISRCRRHAIELIASTDIIVAGNELDENARGIRLVQGSNDNVIQDNEVHRSAELGIDISGSHANQIIENRVTDSGRSLGVQAYFSGGINLSLSDNNVIMGNEITCNSDRGFRLDRGTGSVIAHNRLANNLGTALTLAEEECTGNLIYGNDFVDNGRNAFEYEAAGNFWSFGGEGNYWSDFSSNPGYPLKYLIPGEENDGEDTAPRADWSGCPFRCGDVNGDCGRAELEDFAAFAMCYGLPPTSTACRCADLDGDGAIGMDDFMLFSAVFETVAEAHAPECGAGGAE